MGGFVKGIVVGIVSFGAGFALLAVLLPPPDAVDPLDAGPDTTVEIAGDPEPAPPEPAEPAPEAAEEASDEAQVAADDGAVEDTGAEDTSVEALAPSSEQAETPEASPSIEDTIEDNPANDLAEGGTTEFSPSPEAPLSDGAGEAPQPTTAATDDAPSQPEPAAEMPADAPVTAEPVQEPQAPTEPAPAEEHAEEHAGDAQTPAPDLPEPDQPEPALPEPDLPEPDLPATAEAAQQAPEAMEAEAEAPAPETVEAEIAETEVADAEVVDAEALETEASETEAAETGAAEAGIGEGETTEAEAPEAAREAEAETTPTTEPAAVLRAVPPAPPQPGLTRMVEGVTIGRLPAIGAPDAAAATSDASAAPGADAGAAQPASDTPEEAMLPAYRRFAAAHDAPPGLPLFGVILIDAPATPGAETAIRALPFPVSVALSAEDADAPRRAEAYRQAGHEIVILAEGLPARAEPSDIEVTLDGWLRMLPEAIALLDPPDGAIQGNRQLAQRLAPALAQRGLALLMPERGLNPAQQSARSAGLAHATIFRILDADNESQFTIRRYLDRATFRAQQEGQVLVLGHAAQAETIDGLIGWRMEGRAGQVALAPASATLSEP